MLQFIINHFNYWVYIILMMVGLHAMIAKNNLIKKLIGMSIFQTAIMLFYVSIGVKTGATIPILEHHADAHSDEALQAATQIAGAAGGVPESIDVAHYTNPLPHVLMLTAIVVGVATLGVAMAVVQKVYKRYGSIEENEILKRVKL